MRVLDLFSGIGGFSLGLERAGMRTVAFCEIEAFPRAVLAKHWPRVPCYEDVRSAPFTLGQADLIAGGFPCQDVSGAGERAGLSGARSGLYRHLVRAIRLVRPRFAIVENVAALLGDGMGTVLGDVAESGYDAEWDCIPAGFVGAPHWRDRVWIVAHAVGARLEGWRPTQAARTTQRELAGSSVRVGTSWPDGPNIPRVGYGLPDWVDRVKGLGNAVVPAIPEMLGRAILAAERVSA